MSKAPKIVVVTHRNVKDVYRNGERIGLLTREQTAGEIALLTKPGVLITANDCWHLHRIMHALKDEV